MISKFLLYFKEEQMKKIIAMLLFVLVVATMSVALIGCDGNDTDTDTNSSVDTSAGSTDTSTDTDQQDPNHTHKLPAPPAEDVSSDYEMK